MPAVIRGPAHDETVFLEGLEQTIGGRAWNPDALRGFIGSHPITFVDGFQKVDALENRRDKLRSVHLCPLFATKYIERPLNSNSNEHVPALFFRKNCGHCLAIRSAALCAEPKGPGEIGSR